MSDARENEYSELGGLCQFIRGVTFDSSAVCAVRRPGHLPILRAGNIQDELQLHDDLVWVPEKLVSDEQRLRVGDIAICMSSGSASVVGKTAKVSEPWEGSVGAFCGIVRPNNPNQAEYLFHWFRSSCFTYWRDSQARGNNIQNLRFSQFSSLKIPTPSAETQKRIAAMLNEQMVSAKHAADVADAQLELVARLPRAFLSKRFESSDIASAPKKRVRDLCHVMSGGTPAKDRDDYWGGPIPWITVKDMKTRTVETANLTITETAVAETATHLAPAGAVLVLVRGMGLANGLPICEIRRPSAFNQDIKGLVSLGEVMPAYLAWGLRAQASEILGDRQTVTHGTLKLDTESLLDVDIPVPSLDIQERVSRQLGEDFVLVDQVAVRLAEIKSEVAELPTTLLRQAFSGYI